MKTRTTLLGRGVACCHRAHLVAALWLGSFLLPLAAAAQSDDFGIWTSLEAEKKVNKKLTVGIEAEMRTRDNVSEFDRWSLGVSADYKLAKYLKLGAGYTLLDDHNEKLSYYDGEDDEGEPWEGKVKRSADYWGVRHRVYVGATASVGTGRFKFSLRERWQYTYRPEKTVGRSYYDYDGETGELLSVTANESTKTYKGKGRNVLRSRLQVDYDIPHCKADPYASVELSNAWSVQKVRYTLGVDWRIRKVHTVNLFYRYQNVRNDDFDNEPDSHIIGVGYKYRF